MIVTFSEQTVDIHCGFFAAGHIGSLCVYENGTGLTAFIVVLSGYLCVSAKARLEQTFPLL